MTVKTLAQYLADHAGSHEAAVTALHADLVKADSATEAEAGANIRARAISKALEPLAEALDIPLPPAGARPTQDAAAALSSGVSEALDSLSALEGSRDAWREIAADAGLDVDALEQAKDEAGMESVISGFLSGLEQTRTSQSAAQAELNAYKFAAANQLNPEAVLLQKGLEKLAEREIKTTGEGGKEVTSKIWGIPGENNAFTPALDYLKPVLGALKAQPESTPGTNWVRGQEQQGKSGEKSTYEQYQQEKARQANQGGGYVDPLRPSSGVPQTPAISTTGGQP